MSNTTTRKHYGMFGFLAGIAGGIWFWFGMNVAQFSFAHISLFDAMTDTQIAATNGLPVTLTGAEAFALVFVTTLILAAITGLIGSMAKRGAPQSLDTIVVTEQPAPVAKTAPEGSDNFNLYVIIGAIILMSVIFTAIIIAGA